MRWANWLSVVAALVTVVVVGSSSSAKRPSDPGAALASVLPEAIETGSRCLVRIQGPTGRVRSGIAVDTSTVVTCLSTLKVLGEEELSIVRPSGRRTPVRVAGRDLRLRIVVLQLEADLRATPLEWARPAAPGRLCLALGSSLGRPTATFGMVSAVDRFQGRAYQVDALADPSNYGGPLLDVEGKLLGLVVYVNPSLGTRSGVAFAIPIERVHAVLPRLKRGETLEPGWLGGRIPRVGSDDGVLLRSVNTLGPLAQAGLKPGDRILSLNGASTLSPSTFRNAQLDLVAGQRVELEYSRAGVRRKVVFSAARRPN